MKISDVIYELESRSSAKGRESMARFGVPTDQALGISIVDLRLIAKKFKRNHRVAQELFTHHYHEARILGSLLADPNQLTLQDIDKITKQFDSWDQVDQYCMNLFRHSKFAEEICTRYTKAKQEFVKRTSFSMMAVLAVHTKNNWSDKRFEKFLIIIERTANDERKYVWKAQNWALRQIGKRSSGLHAKALKLSKKLAESDRKAAQFIGRDALRELLSVQVKKRLKL